MTIAQFDNLTSSQLVEFYNRHSNKTVSRFSDRKTAIRRCTDLFNQLRVNDTVKVMKQKLENDKTRPAMSLSLKLDRTITCLETGEIWKNAYRMWTAHPDWMTSSQQDRLTAQLYAAAKNKEQLVLKINGRSFQLVNVGDR